MSKLIFSPCIEMFWGDTPFPDRIAKAASVGFEVVEFWSWWDKDLDAIERAGKDTGLGVSACCVNTNFGGDAPSIVYAGQEANLEKAVRDCIPVSKQLGCRRFIVTTGNEIPDVSRDAQHAACVAALRAAAPVAEDAGLSLVVEPLNLLVDHAGYYLSTSKEGFEIVDEVGSPAVKLLFDIYHQQITEGNLTRNIVDNIAKIGHFHSANHPGRIELGEGEINYPFLLDRIRETEYEGYFGLEFRASDPDRTDAILKDVLALA